MPSGFLILGAAGAGGGTSAGASFFLGSAMTPESPPGPPASGAVWSGCCAGGIGGVVGGVAWDRAKGATVTVIDRMSNAASSKRREVGTDWRRVCMTTSLLNSIREDRLQLLAVG